MKVALLSGSFPPLHCGIGDYTARLASTLAHDDAQLSVTVVTRAIPDIASDAAAPAKVCALPLRWGIRALPRVIAALRRLRPDLVHMQYPALGYADRPAILLLPLLIRLFCRKPVALTIHEFRERGRSGRIATVLIARTANAILVPDAIEAASLRRAIGRWGPPLVDVGMVSTVPIVAHVDLAAWRSRLGFADTDLVISTFGLIHPRRRIEVLIDAVRELRQRGFPVRLLIIGGEAAYDPLVAQRYAEELRRRTDMAGLGDCIHWLGFVESEAVSALLQLSSLCVLLYPHGASQRNTTLMAALEHGTRVITTNGEATTPELRAHPDIVFLDTATLTAATIAEACLDLERQKLAIAGSSHLQRHLAHHHRIYEQLVST